MLKTVLGLIASTLFLLTSCINGLEIPRTSGDELAERNSIFADLIAGGYDIDTTELGIFYILHKEGEGPFPVSGDTCFLEYKGFLLDGTVFDASSNFAKDSVWSFVYKKIDLIPGFDDGISLMNKGTELDMFIPSELGYGANGTGNIPPYSTVLFSTKMHDVKPKTD